MKPATRSHRGAAPWHPTRAAALAIALTATGEPLASQVHTPHTPDEPGGLIAVASTTSTVRPENLGFSEERMGQLQVPQGFLVTVFARDLENPRGMVSSPNGDVYIAEREAGRVLLLRDTNGDGRADLERVVLGGGGDELEGVHDLAVRDDHLYLITVRELYSAPIDADGNLGTPTLHIDDLPDGGQHPNRTIAFGPDGWLYVSVGSQTNAVPEAEEETATLLRVDPNTWEREVFAEGLRNTIGFGWHPVSGNLYGLDHNSDHRGDDWPPEELNHIQEGRHYGWPFCGGDREVDWHVAQDPEGDLSRAEFCADTEAPLLTYTAHGAPMQMVYYTGTQFPAEYRNDAFATMRGSWNRNPPVGYELVRIRFDDAGAPTEIEPFVSGWLFEGGEAHFGRLMGIAQAGDGSLLVGDDTNGVIYRIAFVGGS